MVDYVIPGNDDAVRSVKLLIGVLTNAIAEVNGNEILDFITEDDKAKAEKNDKFEKYEKNEKKFKEDKEIKKDKQKEDKKEENTEEPQKVEEKKEIEAEEVNLENLTLTDLKAQAKEANVKGYSTMKKAELIEALSK